MLQVCRRNSSEQTWRSPDPAVRTPITFRHELVWLVALIDSDLFQDGHNPHNLMPSPRDMCLTGSLLAARQLHALHAGRRVAAGCVLTQPHPVCSRRNDAVLSARNILPVGRLPWHPHRERHQPDQRSWSAPRNWDKGYRNGPPHEDRSCRILDYSLTAAGHDCESTPKSANSSRSMGSDAERAGSRIRSNS
jgi:hypothetical protein